VDLGSSDSYVLRFLRFNVGRFVGRFVVWVAVIHIPFELIGYLGASLVVWVPLIDNLLVFIVLVWRFGFLGCSDSHLVRTARFCADLVVWVPLIHHPFVLLVLILRCFMV